MAEVVDLFARDALRVGQPLPISIEAEQAVLGAILMHNDLVGQLALTLRPEHFGEEIHRRIYDTALDLSEKGKPVTIGTLRTYLGDHDLGGGTTVPQYLARLAAHAMPPLIAPSMASEIRDLAARRQLISIGETLARRARGAGPAASAFAVASETLSDLQMIAGTAVADTRRDPGTCAVAMIERAQAILNGEKRDEGVSTGIPGLDRATAGFQPGTLWVVGGRPRMGKTILATGFAKKIAFRGLRDQREGLQGYGAQIFSLEVAEDQIIARILADLSFSARRRITFGQIMRGAVENEDLETLRQASATLAELPIAIDIASGLSVLEIAAKVRSEKLRMAQRGVRLSVVFIDYLKFVRPSDRYRGNRVYEVGEITRGLKEIAKTENVCIVLLAQLNRNVDAKERKDKAPGLNDLRESGDLEADADVVLFIHRESVHVKQSAEYRKGDAEAIERFLDLEHKADLIVSKTRVGSECTVPVWFDAGASAFSAQARGGIA